MWKTIETLLATEYLRVADQYPANGDMRDDVYWQVSRLLKANGFVHLGEGRHRSVYRSPNGRYVVKVPVCYYGVGANWLEATRWSRRNAKRGGTGYPIAACRTICGGMLLVMQYAEPARNISDCPRWVDYVDCQQVGFTLNGKLVAYDYGS